jgi:hypothetical protein
LAKWCLKRKFQFAFSKKKKKSWRVKKIWDLFYQHSTGSFCTSRFTLILQAYSINLPAKKLDNTFKFFAPVELGHIVLMKQNSFFCPQLCVPAQLLLVPLGWCGKLTHVGNFRSILSRVFFTWKCNCHLNSTDNFCLCWSQSYQTLIYLLLQFLLLSLIVLKYRQYFLMLQTLKLNNKKREKIFVLHRKSLVGFTPGRYLQESSSKIDFAKLCTFCLTNIGYDNFVLYWACFSLFYCPKYAICHWK